MKTPKICITFMLIAFITFPSHAMESALTNQSRPLPLILQTPFSQGLISVAFNPVKSEIALGGSNIISLVNFNTPDKPDTLNLGEDCELIADLAYNPQGTLLANSTPYSLCIWDLEKKAIIQKFNPKTAISVPLFNLDGTKVVMRTEQNIIIWDLTTNTQTHADLNGQVANGCVISLARTFNENTFVHNNPDGTIVWHLDNPSKTESLDISPTYITIFGDNETQLASCSDFLLDGHTIQLMYDRKTTSTQVKGLIERIAYCPRIKKYFFTTTTPSLTDISVKMLDPDNFNITELYHFTGNADSSVTYSFPWFSPDGDKLFVAAGGSEGTLQFCSIDLVNEYTKLLHDSSPQSSSSYRCTII